MDTFYKDNPYIGSQCKMHEFEEEDEFEAAEEEDEFECTCEAGSPVSDCDSLVMAEISSGQDSEPLVFGRAGVGMSFATKQRFVEEYGV
jgi:hypothetical protein